MFLSRGDRDLGVAFQTHPGSQASSRGEAKDSAFLSSRDGYLLEPTEWPTGSQASCGFWREDSVLLSRPCRKRRPSSPYDRGISWVFSSCGTSVVFPTWYDWELKSLSCDAREVRSPCAWRGGVHHCSLVMIRESGLKTRLRRTLEVFLMSRQENLDSLDLGR